MAEKAFENAPNFGLLDGNHDEVRRMIVNGILEPRSRILDVVRAMQEVLETDVNGEWYEPGALHSYEEAF